MKTAREILREAADLIERDGWVQGVYHSEDGRHCAAGALSRALADVDDPVAYETYSLLLDEIGWVGVPMWNDTVATSGQQVVDTLRRAAER
jgi:hypothetical protein